MTEKIRLMERFYTLQGEGCHSGRAAYFIRTAGCPVRCPWCDVKDSWNAVSHQEFSVNEIVNNIPEVVKTVIITGGEPLIWDMDLLTSLLHQKGLKVHLETSGAVALSGKWDWICVSPKRAKEPLDEMIATADELKVVICGEEDFIWAEKHAKKTKNTCALLLQPEWDNRETVMPMITKYVMEHPQWRASLQTHKYMNIP
ncbi:MAG: 7-carboxy-7-deazaguanine synthase QueE [Flavobacteriales bacterium]|nr:7-carboxy-7-deazaguanine synthase QueE [Flavobacteriales bacterium]